MVLHFTSKPLSTRNPSFAQTLHSLFPKQGIFSFSRFPQFYLHGSSYRLRPLATAVSSLSSPAPSNVKLIYGDKKLPFTTQELDDGGVKDWHSATVLSVQELAPGVRSIIVETECSREMVTLENAYSAPGRLAQVKVSSGEVFKLAIASPPFPKKLNEAVLYKVRGDIPAGTTKQAQYFLSVKAPLELLVFQSETPRVFSLKQGDEIEIGPFDLSGLDLRPILFLARFSTVLFFASEKGIALAKAIIETKDADVGSLNLGMRDEIRLFYWSQDPSKVLYKEHFGKWETEKLKVRAAVGEANGEEWHGHVGSLTSLWDEDDIEYDPESTAVVVCVEPKLRKEVHELLSEAGISENQIVKWEPNF